MRVLALASQKGGSGKTTLSGHLAVQAQLAGAGPVVLIDIDHFKQVNDTHGHDAGDRVLKLVAESLARISNETCHVARHGGEEFVLLFVQELRAWGLEVLRLSLAFLPDKDDIDCSQYVWLRTRPGEVTTLRMQRDFLETPEHLASPLHFLATRSRILRLRLAAGAAQHAARRMAHHMRVGGEALLNLISCQNQHLAAAAVLQQHRGAPAPLHQRGQQAPIAAEGRLLAGLSPEAQRCGGLAAQAQGPAGREQDGSAHDAAGSDHRNLAGES